MTDIDLDAIEALAEAATEGPWTVNPNSIMVQLEPPHESVCDVIESTDADAAFIAAARTALPALVARVRELEANLDESLSREQDTFWGLREKLESAHESLTANNVSASERSAALSEQIACNADLRARLEAAERERDEAKEVGDQ